MLVPESLQVFKIFLASPGDLEAERRATREEVNSLRGVFSAFGWAVELLGWEDTIGGYGRPQGQINRDIDDCDLFLGLLWERWGTPPGGDYESGFEEEYARAIERRRKGSAPEIWIRFKRVDARRLDDPGPQLRRVLAFREELQENREVLFGQFATVEEWRANFREALLRYIAESTSRPEATASFPSPSPTPDANRPRQQGPMPAELVNLTDRLSSLFGSEDARSYTAALDELPHGDTLMGGRPIVNNFYDYQ